VAAFRGNWNNENPFFASYFSSFQDLQLAFAAENMGASTLTKMTLRITTLGNLAKL
jgi:hypothetical protein